MIVRRAPGDAADGQVLAVNVDLALVTEPLPDPNERRLERFAALATSGGVPVALVLTKSDLDADGYMKATQLGRAPRRRRRGRRRASAPARASTSCAACSTPGATTVLLGASGTGKSTLINTLLGEERQKTGEIRADGRGRHTTVTRELLTLPGGAFLIDTPGIRIAGLWDGAGDSLRRRRGARARVPLLGLRAHDRAGLRGSRRARTPERIEAWRKLQEELASIEDRRAKSRR